MRVESASANYAGRKPYGSGLWFECELFERMGLEVTNIPQIEGVRRDGYYRMDRKKVAEDGSVYREFIEFDYEQRVIIASVWHMLDPDMKAEE